VHEPRLHGKVKVKVKFHAPILPNEFVVPHPPPMTRQ
jgi:hypothetical protein